MCDPEHLRADCFALEDSRHCAAEHDEHLLMLNCLPDAPRARALGRSIAWLWKTAAIEHWYNNEHLLMFSRLPDALLATPPGRSIAWSWKTAAIVHWYNNEHLLMLSCLPD